MQQLTSQKLKFLKITKNIEFRVWFLEKEKQEVIFHRQP